MVWASTACSSNNDNSGGTPTDDGGGDVTTAPVADGGKDSGEDSTTESTPDAATTDGGDAATSVSPNSGTLSFSLSLPGGAVLSSIGYDLKDSTGAAVALTAGLNPGTVDGSNVGFDLGGVPAASGDSISLTASVSGGGTCQGSASALNVTAGSTTSVTVNMLCSPPGQDAGGLFASSCPTWTSLSTNRRFAEMNVGESLVLTATATGPSPGNLGYTWTMSNKIGAFGATSNGVGADGQDEGVGPSDPMQFMCTAPGTTPVTVAVDDGAIDAGSCATSLTTTTTTVKCDAAPSNTVAAAWVELTGPNGSNGLTGNVAIARAITETAAASAGANPCPTITVNGGTPVQMNVRAGATTSLAIRSVNTLPNKPALFPVSACEYPLPSGVTSAVVAGQSLPVPKANPTKIVVIGDTGCRLQNGNGTQSCNDPNPNGNDTPYPFATIAALAAAQNPDLVLHVGDYAYRDNPCPPGQGYNCGGSPWGFGWDTWQADLFTPGAPLLAAAPWIMTRGNHEQCNRAGQGWFRFLDTGAYDTTGVKTCDTPSDDILATGGNWTNPFLVNINSSTQVVVFDTANAKPESSPALTDGTGAGSLFFTTYASELTTAGQLLSAATVPFNLWSNHHPIFGYATGNPPANPIPAFPKVMASVFPGTYFPPQINLALHGHTHDYQALNFAPATLADGGAFQPAATLVSGNAGDILDTALPYPMTVAPATNISIATDDAGVQEFASSDNGTPFQNPNSSTDNDFGYMVLQFNAASGSTPASWTATEYRTDNTVRDTCTIVASGQMSCASWGIIQPDDAGKY